MFVCPPWCNIDGNYTVYVRQQDAAGNNSTPTTLGFTLDTTAPLVPVAMALAADATTGVASASAGLAITLAASNAAIILAVFIVKAPLLA
jgi:hypothetical protein